MRQVIREIREIEGRLPLPPDPLGQWPDRLACPGDRVMAALFAIFGVGFFVFMMLMNLGGWLLLRFGKQSRQR